MLNTNLEARAAPRTRGRHKTVLTGDGPVRIVVPRDRAAAFEPLLIGRHGRRFTGFDDKIIARCARGPSVRELRAFVAEQYVVEVSAQFVGSVTGAVADEVLT